MKPPKPGLLIFERDDFTCAYCIRVFDHVRLNMDHIYPASVATLTFEKTSAVIEVYREAK